MSFATCNYSDDEEYDDENMEIIEESLVDIATNENSPNQFCKKTRNFVSYLISRFFADKSMHCGGPIPKTLLNDPKYTSMVINYSNDLISAIEKSYSACSNSIKDKDVQSAKKTGDSTEDIKMVNETLLLLSRSGIPKEYAGGMLVMYLDFVKGVDFDE